MCKKRKYFILLGVVVEIRVVVTLLRKVKVEILGK